MNGVIELRNYEFNNKKYKELNIYERDIYEFLYTYVNVSKRVFTVYPSIQTIKRRINLSAPTIIKYIKNLAKKGWLAVSKQKCKMGHYNQYSLKVLWNNTKKPFFEVGENVKSAGSNLVDKVNNIIKKQDVKLDGLDALEASMLDFEEIEGRKSNIQTGKKAEKVEDIEEFEEIQTPQTEEEIAIEKYKLEGRLALIQRVLNPYHKITKSFLALAKKADDMDVFWDLMMPIVDKVVEEDMPVSIRYLENAFKIAINNKKYYKDSYTCRQFEDFNYTGKVKKVNYKRKTKLCRL